ncbi:MAG: beta-galactosidase trimerization domain-containing protein [Alphaproteobacteria bacterium]|nr:beta-galactosidase trimerization domain-containing protein [Alphaproteobacteria bacterium]
MKILIYRDYGCADVSSLYQELTSYFAPKQTEVGFTDAAEIKAGILDKKIKAFFLGGGAGNPFMQKLKGEGNDRIRAYVANGGTYFGICAGAYYACRNVVFEADIPELRIENQCGLNLAEGRAVGTLYKEFQLLPYSLTAFSARVVHVCFDDGEVYPTLYHGGPYFDQTDGVVLARYQEAEGKAALIEKRFGEGKVILSGVHFEDGEQTLRRNIHALRCDRVPAEQNADQMRTVELRRKALFDRVMHLI